MLRVRAGNTYAMPFVVNLGQRNATIINGHLTPLRRMIPQTVAFTMLGRYDLIHSMNAVPLFARCPYIITFEDWMPRTPPDIRLGVLEKALTRVIARERCVALIAMSQFAKAQMMQQQAQSPHYTRLLNKTEVIYPAVPVGDFRPKKLGDSLRLLFVGSDFMRKGLPAVVQAHGFLRRELPIQTTVVSSLRWSPGDYIGPTAREIVDAQRDLLHRSSIMIMGSQPNHVVLELMREHDFLVLPTFHDTFGYVILEAMARGTPVIATETCAIPEIIQDGQNGLLLPLPTDEVGRWEWLYKKHDALYDASYVTANAWMAQAIADKVRKVWHDRPSYEVMSEAARATIIHRFNQDTAREQLENLYDRAVRVFAKA